MIIAIDGPAASGKSTVAKRAAKALGFTFLDTGAMYRAVTLEALRLKLEPSDTNSLIKLANDIEISFKREGGSERVCVDARDVTEEIRMPEVTKLVSVVSKEPSVRRAMVDRQRRFAREADLVAEGRDVGTVVFPNAELKVYLSASLRERAGRRRLELEQKGHGVTLENLEMEIERRDHIDSTREESPLSKAEDAVEIDTTGKTVVQVTEEVMQLVHRRTSL